MKKSIYGSKERKLKKQKEIAASILKVVSVRLKGGAFFYYIKSNLTIIERRQANYYWKRKNVGEAEVSSMAKYKEWFTDKGLRQILDWARLGLTDEQIAKNIGVNRKTFFRWKSIEVDGECPISQVLKKGRAHAVETLENTMFKKATGFYEGEHYYPPDNVSLIFLLKNWAKDYYRDKPYNKAELEGLIKDNKLKDLKIKLFEKELASDNPELSKVDELISRIDREVGSDTQS